MEYDSKRNQCVGFVLPIDDDGLPKNDEFLAISFESMERMFKMTDIAKYAYLYMAHPLCSTATPSCLACLGTNNQFTAKEVLLRWKHIANECKKRDINVVSFGGGGDTRLLKAMKVTYNLFGDNDPLCHHFVISNFQCPMYFCAKNVSALAAVQDIVHVGVKLKARLLTPSIVLPLGKYAAGNHHIRFLKMNFEKDQHGLRNKDVDH